MSTNTAGWNQLAVGTKQYAVWLTIQFYRVIEHWWIIQNYENINHQIFHNFTRNTTHAFQTSSGFKWSIVIMIMKMCLGNIVKIFFVNVIKVVIVLWNYRLGNGNETNQHEIQQLHSSFSKYVNTIHNRRIITSIIYNTPIGGAGSSTPRILHMVMVHHHTKFSSLSHNSWRMEFAGMKNFRMLCALPSWG